MFDDEFNSLMNAKYFSNFRQKGIVVLLYLSGVRVSEAIRAVRKQFHRSTTILYFDVGIRLKGSKETPALPLSLKAPHINTLIECYIGLEPHEKLFPFTSRTARNIVNRFYAYPHFYRANRITRFFLDGYTIPQVKAWTGLNTKNLDYYVNMASVIQMGKSLKARRGED